MKNRIGTLAWLLTFICLIAATALLVVVLDENVLASSGGSVTYYTMSSAPSVTGGGGFISVSPYSSTYTYASGTNLTLTFNNELTPDGSIDYRLDNWYDLPSTQFPTGPLGPGTSVANPVYMTVVNTVPPKAKAVPHYRLIVNKIGSGDVDPGGGYRKEGSVLNLLATPDQGWQFDHWGGDLQGNQNPAQLIMNEPKTVTAYFTQNTQFALTTLVSPAGAGTVTPAGTTYYAAGQNVTLTASPAPGWRYDHWEGGSAGSTNPTTVLMNANKTVTAYFMELPMADFTSAVTTGTVPFSVSFTDTSTPGTTGTNFLTSWSWDFQNDGIFDSFVRNPIHEFTDPGSYDVTLKVTATAGDVSTTTKTGFITANGALPSTNFTANPLTGTAPLSVAFTDTSTSGSGSIQSWEWDFQNDGVVDSGSQNPVFLFENADTYTVSLKVTTQYGNDTEEKTGFITVEALPTADFEATPVSGLEPLTVSFTDLSTSGTGAITSWEWDFDNDGTFDSTEQSPQHTYATAGTYSATLRVTTEHGQDTETKTDHIDVHSLPTADFSASPTSGLEPLTVSFTDLSTPGTGTITSWEWDFGNGETSTLQHPQCLYAAPGLYTVSLTVTTAHGQDVEIKTDYVFVHSPPTADFTADVTAGAAPLTVSFTDFSAPGFGTLTSWAWDFDGDGVIDSTNQNPSHTYAEPGTYTVSLSVTDAAGADTETKNGYIVVESEPIISTFTASPSSVQLGNPVTLSWTTSGANTCVLEPSALSGCGSVAANGSIELTLNASTTFNLTAASTGGVATSQIRVTVLGNPAPLQNHSYGQQYEDKIPPDATIDSYDERRFALVSGTIVDVNDAPLEDVKVTVLKAPQYGTATTDAAGKFTLPVEGGGALTLNYAKDGYLSSQRQVIVPWTNAVVAETVALVQADSAASTITPDGHPTTIITHTSTEIPGTPTTGARACTIVMTGDTNMVQTDGNGEQLQQISSATVRITDYPNPETMPGKLPPQTRFTYCADISLDGIENVSFDKTVYMWVDNFLSFPVGNVVPTGYYDRKKGIWIPSNNGRVVKVLADADNYIIALDADGDGIADDLDGDGYFDDEVAGLTDRQLDPARDTYWRVPINHLSAYDCNWYGPNGGGTPQPGGDPTGGGGAEGEGEGEGEDPRTPYSGGGCYVDYREGVFHEDVGIPGTGFTLHYSSRRVSGYKTVFHIPITSAEIYSTLQKIHVEVLIAGKKLTEEIQSFAPNQAVDIVWDGLDLDGQPMVHSTVARVRIGYEFPTEWFSSPEEQEKAFGAVGTDVELGPGFEWVISWANYDVLVTPSRSTLAEGWTLSVHHATDSLDPSVVIKGDGTVARGPSYGVDKVAGTGTSGTLENGDALLQSLKLGLSHVAVDPAGNFYFVSTDSTYIICKVDPEGILTRFINLGTSLPSDLVSDGAGNLYTAESGNNCIRKIDPDGQVDTVATVTAPTSVAVDNHGNIYTVSGRQAVVQISAAGNQRTLVPAQPYAIQDIAFDLRDDILYYIYKCRYIMRLDLANDPVPTQIYDFRDPLDQEDDVTVESLAVDGTGNLYAASRNSCKVWKIGRENQVRVHFFGTGQTDMTGDGGPSTAAAGMPEDIVFDAAGALFMNSNQKVIRKISSPFPPAGAEPAAAPVFADTNSLNYVFDQNYLHQSTVDAESGVTLVTFGYNVENQLVSITDRFNRITQIHRDAAGVATEIVSPDGIITTLTIDANNHITSVAYPDGGTYQFAYTPEGLMTDEIVNGRHYYHRYDSETGRILELENPLGGVISYSTYTADDTDQVFRLTSPAGDITEFKDHNGSEGFTSVTTDPDGTVTTYNKSADGTSSSNTYPDGTRYDVEFGFDEFKRVVFKKCVTVTTPGGLVRTVTTDRSKNGDAYVEAVAVNGKTSTVSDDVVAGTLTVTSPEGRPVTVNYDPLTLLTTSTTSPGLNNTTYQYDTQGRITSTATGARTTSYTYDAQGLLDTVTEPVTGTVSFDYDPIGRVTSILQPDGNTVSSVYDHNGGLTSLTTPSGKTHTFTYTALGLQTSYITPLNNTYTYAYDDDRRPVSVTYPSNAQVTTSYSLGRLASVTDPAGTTNFSYDSAGRLNQITRGAEYITTEYDGSLPTSVTFGGIVNKVVTTVYNNDFLPTLVDYQDAAVQYTYDDDGLLTQAGAFTIARDAQTGLPTSVFDDAATMTPAYNGYGEVTSAQMHVNDINVAAWNLTYDNAGRIISKTETVGGNTFTYAYTYDAMSRLDTVIRDGVLVEDYDYDAQGRRVSEFNSLRGISGRTAVYNDDDRLVASGDYAYTFDADGFLTSKTDTVTQETTTYAYARTGQLNNVQLPDGTLIEYLHNAAGQRVAKKVNGVITEKYLWAGITGLLAVYDGSDNLLIRFEGQKMVKNGQTYYLVGGQVGSIRAVVDTVGNIVKEITYDSFGNILDDTNPAFTVPLGFAGGLHDRDTGLVRFGFRDYDPDTGTWTAKDPILFGSGDVYLYEYCSSDPINQSDPTGLETFLTSWIPTNALAAAADFAAGMGDAVSMGITGHVRNWMGLSDYVNSGSSWYRGGKIAGTIVDLARGNFFGKGTKFGLKGVRGLGRLRAGVAEEGVYIFDGKVGKYIGSTCNKLRRKAEYLAAKKLPRKNIGTFQFTEVKGGKLAREIAEQQLIDQYGLGNLENVRNAIGQARRHLMP